jgi:hypothetical protein
MRAVTIRTACCSALMLAALAGCGGGGSSSTSPTSLASGTAPAVQSSNKSTQLSVSGTPQASVSAGQAYSFTPSVSDASGTVTFSIQNAPRWASFNASTGQLSGTPQAGDAGTYADVLISVSDGNTTAALPAFTITVAEANSAGGSADISWTAPTTNTNGSTLTDLAGYDIYYGTSASSLTQKVQVTNVGLTNYVISGLTRGTWYFAVAAYTTAGAESSLSNVASTTIS